MSIATEDPNVCTTKENNKIIFFGCKRLGKEEGESGKVVRTAVVFCLNITMIIMIMLL